MVSSKYKEIQEFYSKLKFPGEYTFEDLQYHFSEMRNLYLSAIDQHVENNMKVLDLGAGTGYIVNLFAKKYPNSNFTALDFSDGIDFAHNFALENNINNITFVKENFLNFESNKQFDVIICQGVLHHIPDYPQAVEKILQCLKPGGTLLLGLYHPFGKTLQKILPINYYSEILKEDQLSNPFELCFTQKKVSKLLPSMELVGKYPKHAFLFTKSFIASGGLILYVFRG